VAAVSRTRPKLDYFPASRYPRKLKNFAVVFKEKLTVGGVRD
jgi:hypothetical protein